MQKDTENQLVSFTELKPSIKDINDLHDLIAYMKKYAQTLKHIFLINQINSLISIELVKELANALTACSSLETLTVENFKEKLGIGIVDIMGAALNCFWLKKLSFAGTYIAKEGMIALVKLSTNTSIKYLNLKDSAILPDIGYLRLGRILKANTQLRELDLSNNPIGSCKILYLCIKKNDRSRLTKLSFNHPKTCLENENLYHDRLTKTHYDQSDDGTLDFENNLEHANRYLEWAKNGDKFFNELFQEEVQSINELQDYLARRRLFKVTSVADYQLAITEIYRCDNLLDIILYADKPPEIQATDVLNLATALQKCRQLERLSIQHFDNVLGKDVCQLISAISGLPSLTKLDLSFTLLGKLGFEVLSRWIRANPPLKKLNITHCGLYAMKSFRTLSRALKVNNHIELIKMSHNFLDAERCLRLANEIFNKNIVLLYTLEKSWHDYLALLSHFITSLPWDYAERDWDQRDGDPLLIQQTVQLKTSDKTQDKNYREACTNNMALQRYLVGNFKASFYYKQKLLKKIETGLSFFQPNQPKINDSESIEEPDDSAIMPLEEDEKSYMLSTIKTGYGTR